MPEGIFDITKYPSRFVAAPIDVLLIKTFAYDMGSPLASFLTKPLMLDEFCATKKVSGINMMTFIDRRKNNESDRLFNSETSRNYLS